jgi:hypothetical protein
MVNWPASNGRGTWGLPGMNSESTGRDQRRETVLRHLAVFCIPAPLMVVGCYHAPEYTIFGSFFPAWIFCSVGGLLLAMGARAAIARMPVGEYLATPVLLYLSTAIFFACVLWVVFYG